jgi:hypothetical protein
MTTLKVVNLKGVPLERAMLKALRSDACSSKRLDNQQERKSVAKHLADEMQHWLLATNVKLYKD